MGVSEGERVRVSGRVVGAGVCLLMNPMCSPRDSQESSPTPHFKSINSLALSLLHSPTLTSLHDHWKNHPAWNSMQLSM